MALKSFKSTRGNLNALPINLKNGNIFCLLIIQQHTSRNIYIIFIRNMFHVMYLTKLREETNTPSFHRKVQGLTVRACVCMYVSVP